MVNFANGTVFGDDGGGVRMLGVRVAMVWEEGKSGSGKVSERKVPEVVWNWGGGREVGGAGNPKKIGSIPDAQIFESYRVAFAEVDEKDDKSAKSGKPERKPCPRCEKPMTPWGSGWHCFGCERNYPE